MKLVAMFVLMLLSILWSSISIIGQDQLGRSPSRALFPRLNVESHTAPIRAIVYSRDSGRLYTGGMDKVVQSWRLDPSISDGKTSLSDTPFRDTISWQRTLRWEVERGLRGSIHALALSPIHDRLAIAGYGQRGSLGEIVWIDPTDGTFQRTEHDGHRQSIAALAYSSDGYWLASSDLTGRVLVRGHEMAHEPVEICAADNQSVGLRPLTFLSNRTLVVPSHVGQSRNNEAHVWKLTRYDLREPGSESPNGDTDSEPVVGATRRLEQLHFGMVTALAATADGRRLASADLARRLYLWDFKESDEPQLLCDDAIVLSLAFSADGKMLMAGTGVEAKTRQSEIRIWDSQTTALTKQRSQSAAVVACAFSPDGKQIAYVGGEGRDIVVERADQFGKQVTIQGGLGIASLNATSEIDSYRVSFVASGPVAGQGVNGAVVFDPTQLTRSVGISLQPDLPQQAKQVEWNFTLDRTNNRLQLTQRGLRRGYIQVNPATQGNVQCSQWINDQDGVPVALAIGTDVHNGVYVYDLTTRSILRFFRGHQARVTCMSMTSDGRYLVSGAADGTIRYWSLTNYRDKEIDRRRWGTRIRLKDESVIVQWVDDAGPLFYRGLQPGDVISEILWRDEHGHDHSQTNPQTIIQLLDTLPWFTQVGFKTSRQGQALEVFQQVSGWHHLLGVFFTQRDWIAWTPAGYYACSAGGEQLMGWQVNNQLGEKPSFFPAVRFYKSLYRPDVIKQLLVSGSLSDAIAKNGGRSTQVADVIPPKIRILSPKTASVTVDQSELLITAEAEAMGEQPITQMHLLLNGSPASGESKGIVRERTLIRQSWSVRLPAGRHRIGVMAETSASQGMSEEVLVEFQPSRATRSLHLLAIGISEYPGPLKLNFSDDDARNISSVFQERSQSLFHEINVHTITDKQADRSAILAGMQWLKERSSLGDLAIFFFSGHGETRDQSFYFLPSDVDPLRIEQTSLTDTDIKQMCKELGGNGTLILMIDACHSGAMQLDRLALQLSRPEFGVIMMSSSTGDEKSLESSRWQGGAFSVAVVEGLKGAADRFGNDRLVKSDELAAYVNDRVLEITENRQTPLLATPGVPPFPLSVVPQSN